MLQIFLDKIKNINIIQLKFFKIIFSSAPVAQEEEQRFSKPSVIGSNPIRGANFLLKDF